MKTVHVLHSTMNSLTNDKAKTPLDCNAEEIVIVCIGSPFGSDSVGLRLGDLLQQRKDNMQIPVGLQILTYDRPGMNLLPVLENADCVVIIDAVLSPCCPGEVMQLQVEALLQSGPRLSSHEIGVAQVLAMAAMLNQMPRTLYLFGISVGEAAEWLPGLEQLNQLADTLLEHISHCSSFSSFEFSCGPDE